MSWTTTLKPGLALALQLHLCVCVRACVRACVCVCLFIVILRYCKSAHVTFIADFFINLIGVCLHCFDTVGWASGRASWCKN